MCLQTGRQLWQQLRSEGQQDFSGFLAFLLGWMNTKTVSHRFAKRYLTADGAKTVDQGGKHTPITLVLTLGLSCQFGSVYL